MAMIIRGGTLITMTQQGSFVGDVMIRGGRILRVDERIEESEGAEVVLDARSLHIMPAMVDACIGTGGADPVWLREYALSCGITSGLILPEEGDRCSLLDGGEIRESAFRWVDAGLMDAQELLIAIDRITSGGYRPVIAAPDEACVRRLLPHLEGANAILTGKPYAACTDEIARAGASVVIGGYGDDDPFGAATDLLQVGAPTAISCRYPQMKLRLLPVLAGLYARNGMQHDDALAAITRLPANILGLRDRGMITPGHRADLLIFDGDPLLLASVHLATIVGGRVLRGA